MISHVLVTQTHATTVDYALKQGRLHFRVIVDRNGPETDVTVRMKLSMDSGICKRDNNPTKEQITAEGYRLVFNAAGLSRIRRLAAAGP